MTSFLHGIGLAAAALFDSSAIRIRRGHLPASLYEDEQRRRRRNMARVKRERKRKRLLRSLWGRDHWFHSFRKPGTRPLSIMHPDHPARRFGRDDDRYVNRDRLRWE